MKRLLLSFVMVLVIYSAGLCADPALADMGTAKEWCDATMLHRVEGIWEFPEDETRVLIKRSGRNGEYALVVISTPDCRLSPGEEIGYLRRSASSSKYEMGLFRKKEKGILTELGKCLAEYNEKDDALFVSSRKFKVSLSSRWFLPSFWRAVRIRLNDPTEKIPKGLVRIYPESSAHREPDYL